MAVIRNKRRNKRKDETKGRPPCFLVYNLVCKPETESAPPRRSRREVAPNKAPPASVRSLLALRHEAHLAELPQQPLMPFDGTSRLRAAVPFAFEDYLELVETTGRCLHPGKRGKIAGPVPKLLQRLEIDPERFIDCTTNLLRRFGSAVGAPARLTELCAARQVRYLRGMGAAREAFEKKAA